MRFFNGFAALMVAAALFTPIAAPAAIVKQVSTFTIPDGEASSNVVISGLDGVIRYARVVTPDDTPTTFTINAWCGPDIGEIELATTSVSTEGTSTISAFASVPIAGETRVAAIREDDVDEDTVFYLIVLVER
ncbi:MAG: hypothetical protein GC208_10380 [Alphaproteobacteria bacterium]|nr:hypothetical protein [Alphaproteobacteria bacterium]